MRQCSSVATPENGMFCINTFGFYYDVISFQIPGYGCKAVLLIADATTQSTFNNLFPASREPAEIGSTPPNFNAKIDCYQIDILRMVVFYNENFGIAAQDNLEDRITKFRGFLLNFYLPTIFILVFVSSSSCVFSVGGL